MREPKEPEGKEKAHEKEQSRELSPEEQMERYEEDLKESDWGHQPC